MGRAKRKNALSMARMGGQDGSSVIINVTGELVVIFIPLFLQRSDL